MSDHKVLAVDFDGVISRYEGWKGLGVFGPPFTGCKEELQKLRDAGWTIILFTTRGDDIGRVQRFMFDHSIPYDYVNCNAPTAPENVSDKKVLANVYLDDRAITFDGNWEGMADKIKEFSPHFQRQSVSSTPLDEAERRFKAATDNSLSIMITKNKQRGDCWRGTGVVGAFMEMRAIFFRLRNLIWEPGPPDREHADYNTWKADVIDAMRDLRNFTILGELSAEDDNLKGTGDEL